MARVHEHGGVSCSRGSVYGSIHVPVTGLQAAVPFAASLPNIESVNGMLPRPPTEDALKPGALIPHVCFPAGVPDGLILTVGPAAIESGTVLGFDADSGRCHIELTTVAIGQVHELLRN